MPSFQDELEPSSPARVRDDEVIPQKALSRTKKPFTHDVPMTRKISLPTEDAFSSVGGDDLSKIRRRARPRLTPTPSVLEASQGFDEFLPPFLELPSPLLLYGIVLYCGVLYCIVLYSIVETYTYTSGPAVPLIEYSLKHEMGNTTGNSA